MVTDGFKVKLAWGGFGNSIPIISSLTQQLKKL
jgi:hypothetical protein